MFELALKRENCAVHQAVILVSAWRLSNGVQPDAKVLKRDLEPRERDRSQKVNL